MPERSSDSPEFQKARELLASARLICILGFGFDEINLRRLGIKKWEKGSVAVFGSAYLMETNEIRIAVNLIEQVWPIPGPGIVDLGKSDEDALMLLRRYPIFH